MFPCLSPLVDKPLLLNLSSVLYFIFLIGRTEYLHLEKFQRWFWWLAKVENHCVKLPEIKNITGLYNSGDDIMSLNFTAELTDKGKSMK